MKVIYLIIIFCTLLIQNCSHQSDAVPSNKEILAYKGRDISELESFLGKTGERCKPYYYGVVPDYALLDKKTGLSKIPTYFADFHGIKGDQYLRAEVIEKTGEIMGIFFVFEANEKVQESEVSPGGFRN